MEAKAQTAQQARTAAQAPATTEAAQAPATTAPTYGERFVAKVMSEFTAQMGGVKPFSEYERTLAQHLFIKIDNALREAESKRKDFNKPPITWDNVDTRTLAPVAVNRVQNGLDALLRATIYPIAYLNGRTGKYDIDLRIGYLGELYIAKEKALDPPKDIRLELVYSTDKFKALKKTAGRDVESYEYEITNPFKRGTVVGAFGYIAYDDATKNELVLVDMGMIDKSQNKAMSKDFWNSWYDEMCYKTLVHKVCKHIQPDPMKVNAAYFEAQNDIDAPRYKEDQIPQEAIDGSFDDITPEIGQQHAIEQPVETQAYTEPAQTTQQQPRATQGVTSRPGQQSMQFGVDPGF